MGEWRIDSVDESRPGDAGHPGKAPLIRVQGWGDIPAFAYALATDGDRWLHLKLLVNRDTGNWEVTQLGLFNASDVPMPFTGSILRTIPVARLASEAAPLLQELFGWGDLSGTGAPQRVPAVPNEVREEWPDGDQQRVFRWVTTVYQAALATGQPPTKAVASAFHVSHDKAAYLVRRARQAGVLTVSSANDPTKRKDRSNSNGGEVRD